MELLRDLIRARALETLLARRLSQSPDGDAILPVSPAVPAVRALHAMADGTGDVYTQRVGSPAAALALGASPHEVLRQRLGTAAAAGHGMDPGGFPTDLQRGLLGPVRIPGALLEVVCGIAIAFKLREEKRVALLLDDLTGTAAGDWHEGLNFAAVQAVPMVLVVQAGGRVPADRGLQPLGERAAAYGFRHHTVSGQDPREVEKVIWTAVEVARTGGGLQVVEVAAPASEPVDWLVDQLVAAGALSHDDARRRIDEADREMLEALAEVEAEAHPDPDALLAQWGIPGPSGALPTTA